MSDSKTFKRTILIDFDGVLHHYLSQWQGVDKVLDDPTPGAIEWLKLLIASEDFDPCIYSARSKDPKGIWAMCDWLHKHGMTEDEINQLKFPTEKPSAWLTIDDRALQFVGVFPTLPDMITFKPWNRP